MRHRKRLLIAFSVLTVLSIPVTSGCGTTPEAPGVSSARLFNRWLGYCYVYAGETIDARFAFTGTVPQTRSYLVKGDNRDMAVQDFSINGRPGDPWRTAELDWSVSRAGRAHFVPLSITLSSQGGSHRLTLGDWYVNALNNPGRPPLREREQSLGEVLKMMPKTYPFSIDLRIARPGAPTDLTLITNASPRVVKLAVKTVAREGRNITLTGVLSFAERSRQIYLIPALSYRFGATRYIQPLQWPMAFAVFPSSDTQSFSEGNIKL